MASGDTLLQFGPYSNEPPASNYATLDTRNQHPVLDFDAAADEGAVFSAVMPQHYAGTTGVTVYIHWAASSATSGDTVWEASFERVGTALDIDADSFAAIQYVADTCSGTSGIVQIAAIAFTDGAQMDSIAVGEKFRLKISRDADSTNDTDDMAGDAELVAVEIRET